MEVVVQRAGLFTTVQDLGRRGYRNAGVPVSGAMDPFALRVANLLVGNEEDAAGLEATAGGLELLFPERCVVAIGGAEFPEVPSWRPLAIPAGGALKLGRPRRGYRAYVAVRGGIGTEPVLGSRSTYSRARMGGFEGRPLREGDRIPIVAAGGAAGGPPAIAASWEVIPAYSHEAAVRVVPGAQADWFSPEWGAEPFEVTPKSDRMGLRLKGPAQSPKVPKELLSAGVAPGTIQIPPDGQPIVLGADAQTIGGYPQIAHVISVDMPLIAQLGPGDKVRFRTVTLAEAQWLSLKREQEIALLRAGATARWRDFG